MILVTHHAADDVSAFTYGTSMPAWSFNHQLGLFTDAPLVGYGQDCSGAGFACPASSGCWSLGVNPGVCSEYDASETVCVPDSQSSSRYGTCGYVCSSSCEWLGTGRGRR